MGKIFVAGTDTDIGKTFVSQVLCLAFSKVTETTYYKPVQSGQPTDTDQIKALLGNKISYKMPTYEFALPASPNRSAAAEDRVIELDRIKNESFDGNFHIVEGAGGLMVPLNDQDLVVDLPKSLDMPVVLVASTRLGTINHTLLSVEALKNRGLDCLGIILNGDEDPGLRELIESQAGLPVLFEVPKLSSDFSTIDDYCQSNEELKGFVDFCLSNQNDQIIEDLNEIDRRHVWHPFTQHGIVKNHPVVTSGEGSYLNLDGHKVIDAVSSWWVNLFGHSHPRLVNAMKEQALKLEHVIFAGFTHEPAIQLSEGLVSEAKRAGTDLDKVFFSDNGSTSVEVALKMAYQHQRQSGKSRKTRFLALSGSYHGDTLGAMSLGERKGFNDVFTPLMFDVDFVDPFDHEKLQKTFDENGSDYAAVIVEPMVQGASGMRMYGASYLNQLARLAKEHQCFVICDEVFTGFYRTGKMFAFEHSDLKPDFLCLSKGITGGFLPLSVTMTSESIYESFYNSDMRKAFLHGHSYTANPIACRVACETLKMLNEKEVQDGIENITQWTRESIGNLSSHKSVHNQRVLGTIGAFELNDDDPNYFKGDFSYRLNQAALKKGVLLRPLGGTLYTVPPYLTTEEQFKKIYKTIEELIEEEI